MKSSGGYKKASKDDLMSALQLLSFSSENALETTKSKAASTT